jgi:hypothetical protein
MKWKKPCNGKFNLPGGCFQALASSRINISRATGERFEMKLKLAILLKRCNFGLRGETFLIL